MEGCDSLEKLKSQGKDDRNWVDLKSSQQHHDWLMCLVFEWAGLMPVFLSNQ